MTESRNDGMTDRLKTVYPPKTSFCGGYKQYTPLKLRFAGGITTYSCQRSWVVSVPTSSLTEAGLSPTVSAAPMTVLALAALTLLVVSGLAWLVQTQLEPGQNPQWL